MKRLSFILTVPELGPRNPSPATAGGGGGRGEGVLGEKPWKEEDRQGGGGLGLKPGGFSTTAS